MNDRKRLQHSFFVLSQMCIESPVSIVLIETKAMQWLWHVEDGSEKREGNLYVGFVILQAAQG